MSFARRYGGHCADCGVVRDYHGFGSMARELGAEHPFRAIKCPDCGHRDGFHADDCPTMGRPRDGRDDDGTAGTDYDGGLNR